MNKKYIIISVIAVIVIIIAIAASGAMNREEDTMQAVEGQTPTTTGVLGGTVTNTTVKTTNTQTSGGRVMAPEKVSLKVGQTGETLGLGINFRSVLNDSRCPSDVKCIQAGWVEADVIVNAGDKKSEVVIKSNGEVVTFAGYKISITEVSPTKTSERGISKDAYRLDFNVAPTASAANI